MRETSFLFWSPLLQNKVYYLYIHIIIIISIINLIFSIVVFSILGFFQKSIIWMHNEKLACCDLL
jgi:hypothetical protein